MKSIKLTKVLSLVLTFAFTLSVFSTNAFAASRADEYKRDLTAEEVTLISSIFDAEYYASVYADVMDYYGYDYYTTDCDTTLLTHFLSIGIWEERQPNASFNIDVYATRNVDLRAAYGDDIISYYVYYATHLKEQSWRVVPTWADAYANGVTIYSVYDLVAGSSTEVKAGAYPVQTANYAPNLGIN